MLYGIGKLSSVSTTNVCKRDGDVLLNTLEDDLHTRVPLLLKTKRTSILPPYILRAWGSSPPFPSINALPLSAIPCNNYRAQGRVLMSFTRDVLA